LSALFATMFHLNVRNDRWRSSLWRNWYWSWYMYVSCISQGIILISFKRIVMSLMLFYCRFIMVYMR